MRRKFKKYDGNETEPEKGFKIVNAIVTGLLLMLVVGIVILFRPSRRRHEILWTHFKDQPVKLAILGLILFIIGVITYLARDNISSGKKKKGR